MIQVLNQQKVSYFDLNSMEANINELHDRLKHVSVIQSELASGLIPLKQATNSKFMDNEDN